MLFNLQGVSTALYGLVAAVNSANIADNIYNRVFFLIKICVIIVCAFCIKLILFGLYARNYFKQVKGV